MKVLIIANTSGNEEGDYNPGDIVDLREDIAADWLNRGWALPHKEPEVERAVPAEHETATGKGQQKEPRAPQHPPEKAKAKAD